MDDLVKSIEHWNEYRVPILKISLPDKHLNFKGAIRFYFQDAGQKVSTKCVNVTSADTTKDVIDVLIEKFRPDMRMLSVPEYGLYEIHENGDERKLELNERPLYVQLEWNKDDREGRFLLRRMDEKTKDLISQNEEPSLKKNSSKKDKKKQEKLKKQQEKADAAASKLAAKNKNGIAERLYNELPETSFTRSISNPEAVMKRRRAQKLEKRLQEFSLEGGQDAGGTLRIFGETINKDVSYKTLLLSTRDTASSVVKQILEKYGKDSEDPSNYCLVQLVVPHSAATVEGDKSMHGLNNSSSLRESILDDQDCPLLINQNHDKSRGILTFHIRHKPADYQKRRKKKPLHPLVVQELNQRLQINNSNGNSINNGNNNNNSDHYINQEMGHEKNGTQFAPQFAPQHLPQNVTQQQHIPQHLAQNGPHHLTPHLPQHVPQYMPQQHVPQYIPQHVPHYVPQQPPQYVAQHLPQYVTATGANDQILPALIQVKEEVEDIFLNRVITHIDPTKTAFRLAPTYVLYMVSRYRASTLFHPELQAPSRAELFVPFTRKIATMIRNAIEIHIRDPTCLAFWLANASDLCHFYKQDKHLSHFTIEAQEILYDSIKASFKYLLSYKQMELDSVLHLFFDERNDLDHPMNQILNVLNDTMATLRKNRVNAALTIQIFSHLFHHISRWLFERLIGVYSNRLWGERLAMISKWAEKQGLEQAADFYFARVTLFLKSGEYPNEKDFDLKIPFLVPDEGYSSEMIRYIPSGLLDFVSQLSKFRVGDQELCIFTVQPTSSGFWTVYFRNHQQDTPDIIMIQLRKKNNSMGLSIIAARGVGQERLGIYIKNVVKNGAAAMDGRLQAGDQLLEVDGNSLLDITQEIAAELMQRTGPIVTLKIAKQAATYHNLSDVINSVPTQTIVPEQLTPQSITQNPTSPLKSPKKVSWVDNHPDHSLHTLIPPSPAPLPPSPTLAPSPQGHETNDYPPRNYYALPPDPIPSPPQAPSPEMAQSPNLAPSPPMVPSPPLVPPPPLVSSPHSMHIPVPNGQVSPPQARKQSLRSDSEPMSNGLDATTESLTLEDINEVLSSKTLEDSAGVIGTQEVYNDPRQRIVRARERPNEDVNIEKLSFQEKLKMFNISAKK